MIEPVKYKIEKMFLRDKGESDWYFFYFAFSWLIVK